MFNNVQQCLTMHRIQAKLKLTNDGRYERDKEENKPVLWFSLFEVLQLRKEQLRYPQYSSSRSHPSSPVPVTTWSRVRTGLVLLVNPELRSKITNGLLPCWCEHLDSADFGLVIEERLDIFPPPWLSSPLSTLSLGPVLRSCESLNSSPTTAVI